MSRRLALDSIAFDDGDIDVLEVLDELTIDEGASYSIDRAAPQGSSVVVLSDGEPLRAPVARTRRGTTVVTLERHGKDRIVVLRSPLGARPFVRAYGLGRGADDSCVCAESLGKGEYRVWVDAGFAGLLSVSWT